MQMDSINIEAKVNTDQLDQALEKAEKLKKLTEESTLQNRLRSPIVWTTITTGLLALFGEWGLYDIIGIKQELIQHTITFLISCFIIFGVFNNPTNKEGF